MPSVLFLSRLYAPHQGGVEKHVQMISRELVREGYTIQLITEQFDADLPLVEVIEYIEIHRIPHSIFTSKLKLWIWMFQHRALFSKADIVHIHDVFWWVLPIWAMIARKVFMTFHGYEGSQPPGWKQIFWHRLGGWCTRANLAIGDFHSLWYGVQPTVVSYGAVEPLKHPKRVKMKKNSAIFIGRLDVDTGIQEYLSAIEILSQKKASISLDIYGTGPLEAACKQNFHDQKLPVTFHGWDEQAVDHLPNYTVACVSRYLSILEALQAGVPIVAQYNNQIKKDYLILAPFAKWISIVQTPEEIAEALQHPKPLPHAANTWIQQQTWKNLTGKYLQLWKGQEKTP